MTETSSALLTLLGAGGLTVAAGPGYDPELASDPVYLGSVYEHYDTSPYWGVGYGYPTYPYYPGIRRNMA